MKPEEYQNIKNILRLLEAQGFLAMPHNVIPVDVDTIQRLNKRKQELDNIGKMGRITADEMIDFVGTSKSELYREIKKLKE